MLDKPHPPGTAMRAQEQTQHQARTLRIWALIVLVPVALIGAALSFQSLYLAAVPVFGGRLALGFPLLVDFLILGASLQYVAGAKIGRPRAGWRWTAHAGVAGTLILNAMAARVVREVPWHVTAPAVWSVLVELTAREVLGQWRAAHIPLGDRIPLRLWLTAPLESSRTWLRIARRVEGEQAQARLDVGVHAAAVEALKLALPQRRARRVRHSCGPAASPQRPSSAPWDGWTLSTHSPRSPPKPSCAQSYATPFEALLKPHRARSSVAGGSQQAVTKRSQPNRRPPTSPRRDRWGRGACPGQSRLKPGPRSSRAPSGRNHKPHRRPRKTTSSTSRSPRLILSSLARSPM